MAAVLPREGAGFDPAAIPKAIQDAGFSAVNLEITAVGKISRREDVLVFEVPPDGRRWVLAGGEGLAALEAALPEPDSSVRVRGRLHPAHDDHPPGMTVEDWEEARPAP